MASAAFISDHMHTMRSGQRWSVNHRQSCDGRLLGQIIEPTLSYVAFVILTLYSVKENTHVSAGTERYFSARRDLHGQAPDSTLYRA